MFRVVSAGHVATLAQPRLRPRLPQVVTLRVIFAYSDCARAGVEGGASPPAMLVAPREFRICSAYVSHNIRRPCGHVGPAQGEAQVVRVRIIFEYSGPARA